MFIDWILESMLEREGKHFIQGTSNKHTQLHTYFNLSTTQLLKVHIKCLQSKRTPNRIEKDFTGGFYLKKMISNIYVALKWFCTKLFHMFVHYFCNQEIIKSTERNYSILYQNQKSKLSRWMKHKIYFFIQNQIYCKIISTCHVWLYRQNNTSMPYYTSWKTQVNHIT